MDGGIPENNAVVPAGECPRGLRQISRLLATASSAASPATASTRDPAGWLSVQVSAAGSSSIATTLSSSPRRRSTNARPIRDLLLLPQMNGSYLPLLI